MLKGGDDDENAALWAMVSRGSPTSLDGDWSSRWKCPDPQCGWHTGLSRVQTVGERVFIVHRDLGTVYLIEARREGDRLIGKYQNARLEYRRDAFPWFGRIVDGERIDGVWRHGNGQFLRWDLRRRLAAASDK